jgi:hypothetical protein
MLENLGLTDLQVDTRATDVPVPKSWNQYVPSGFYSVAVGRVTEREAL